MMRGTKKIWDSSWKESDDFFYDNPEIAEKYGLITCIDDEALRRIKEYEGLKRIIVCTNSNLVAPKNYESVGFRLYDRKPNATESAFTGDYLYYEIVL